MCSVQHEKSVIQILKEHLNAAHYFNTTSDEFIDIARSIYIDVFGSKILAFAREIKDKFPDIDESKHKEIIKSIYVTFDEFLKINLNFLENYALESVFRIPRFVELEQDKEMSNLLKTFSQEENDNLDKQLVEVSKSIRQKRAFIKCLRNRQQLLELIEKALDKFIETNDV